ncbi:hypothetical protein JCM10213_001306 [Rhodosporidiobolus nylandii]
MRYLLAVLALTSLALLREFLPSLPSSSHGTPRTLHPTLVAPRPFYAPDGRALYTSCTADELLASLKTAQIRPDGASRFPNFTTPEDVTLRPLEWSFGFGGIEGGKVCELPKVFSPQEACELLSAFGGVYSTGDSFSRHFHSALLMLLRGRIDGAIRDYRETDDCRGDRLFDDGKLCRQRIVTDTDADEPVCGGAASLMFLQTYRPDAASFSTFHAWRSRLPRRLQLYSPLYLTGLGSHFDFDTSPLVPTYFDELFSSLSHSFPAAFNLFLGPHKPGANQPKIFVNRQGPDKVRAFKDLVPLLLREREEEREWYRGGVRYVDMYEMSDGATSFDGVHYSRQINLEKVQIVLNLLDILWGQVVAAGGMVVLE